MLGLDGIGRPSLRDLTAAALRRLAAAHLGRGDRASPITANLSRSG